MRMSPQGRKLLTQREGLRLKAYKDSVGVWTIGVGHAATSGMDPIPRAGMTITCEQADAILSRDLVTFENAINQAVKVPLTQGQFDALCSLAFNIGTGGFKKSTVVRRLNEGNYRAAADAFLMWAKPAVLIGRRRAERMQFLDATGKNGTGKPIKFVAASDLHEGEQVNREYLKASGSRTINAVDTAKKAIATIAVAVPSTTAAIEMSQGAVNQISQAVTAAQQAQMAWAWAYENWVFLIGSLVVAVCCFAVWFALNNIEKARVEDAVYTGD